LNEPIGWRFSSLSQIAPGAPSTFRRTSGVRSAEPAMRAAAARIASAPREEWVLLRGWIPREWGPERRVRATLDRIAAGRPLVLYAVDGHSVWASGAALARDEDFARFKSLGVLASVQPIHQVTDRAIARRHWGARTSRSYAWKRLLTSGARLLLGSDAPFDRAGPLLALTAALLRREGGEPPDRAFHPEQRLRLAQALQAHLEAPHLAAGWKTPLGRLAPGFGADLVVFDHDLTELDPGSWGKARARAVWIDGRPEPVGK